MRPGSTAATTKYVVDLEQRRSQRPESPGINLALRKSSELLQRLADALVAGRIVAPPITCISLEGVPLP